MYVLNQTEKKSLNTVQMYLDSYTYVRVCEFMQKYLQYLIVCTFVNALLTNCVLSAVFKEKQNKIYLVCSCDWETITYNILYYKLLYTNTTIPQYSAKKQQNNEKI